MALKRLLYLSISILRRVLDLKSYIQPPLKCLLWLLSKLRRIVNLGSRTLLSSETSSEGCREISYYGSFFSPSQQPPPTGAQAGECEHALGTIHTPGSAALSIQPSERNSSQPHDYSPSQVSKVTMTDPLAITSETFERNLGFRRPDLCEELVNLNLLAIAPTEYQRYDRNEVMCV